VGLEPTTVSHVLARSWLLTLTFATARLSPLPTVASDSQSGSQSSSRSCVSGAYEAPLAGEREHVLLGTAHGWSGNLFAILRWADSSGRSCLPGWRTVSTNWQPRAPPAAATGELGRLPGCERPCARGRSRRGLRRRRPPVSGSVKASKVPPMECPTSSAGRARSQLR
jgi:hypothetical protein